MRRALFVPGLSILALATLGACAQTCARDGAGTNAGDAAADGGNGASKSIIVARTYSTLPDDQDAFDANAPHRTLDTDLQGEGLVHAATSPDGKWIVTWGGYGKAMLYERATGAHVTTLNAPLSDKRRAIFSHDSKHLALAAGRDLLIFDVTRPEPELVWRATLQETPTERSQTMDGVVGGFTWSRDDASVMWSLSDGRVSSIALATGAVTPRFTLPALGSHLVWSQDEKTIAVAVSRTNGVSLYDGTTGALKTTVAGDSTNIVLDQELDPEGRRLALLRNVSHHAAITIIDVAKGAVTATLVPDASSDLADRPDAGPSRVTRLEGLAWSADGKRLAVLGSGSSYIVDVDSNGWKAFGPTRDNLFSVAWTGDAKELVVGSKGVAVYDALTLRPVRRISDTMASDASVACSKDGRVVVVADTELGLAYVKIDAGELIVLPSAPPPAGRRNSPLAVSADGTRASFYVDRTSELRDVELATGESRVVTFEGGTPSGELRASPDGRNFVGLPQWRDPNARKSAGLGSIGAEKEQARIFDARTGKITARLAGVEIDKGSVAAWSRASDVVAVSLEKGGVNLFDAKSGAKLRTIASAPAGHDLFSSVPVIAFSVDGAKLLTIATNDTSTLMMERPTDVWTTATGKKEGTLPFSLSHGAVVLREGWVAEDGALVEMATGKKVVAPPPHHMHYGNPSNTEGCTAPDGRFSAFPGVSGVFFLRTNGSWLDLERVPVGDGWGTLAIASDGTFDVRAGAATGDALASTTLRLDGKIVRANAIVDRQREGLAAKWLATPPP